MVLSENQKNDKIIFDEKIGVESEEIDFSDEENSIDEENQLTSIINELSGIRGENDACLNGNIKFALPYIHSLL